MKKIIYLFMFVLLTFQVAKSEGLYIGAKVGDCNCDGKITVSDGVFIFNYIFGNGPEPYCTPLILEENYGYTIYDSLTVKKKSYVVVNKVNDWTRIKLGCFNLDKTDALDIYQKIQYYVKEGIVVKADTTITMDFKIVNSSPNDSCYLTIERE